MIILKNLLGRRTRTLLTLLGIAIGVTAVVSLGALGEGFIQGYSAMSGGSGSDLLVMQDEALDIMFSAIDQDIRTILEGYSDVTAVSEMIYTFGATDGAPYMIIYGYHPAEFAIQHFKIIDGLPLPTHQTGRSGKPILLGKATAESLDKEVGDTFRVYESTFRIVGIYETGEAFEDGAVVMHIADAQIVNGTPNQVNAFMLKVRDGTDLERLQERIENRFDDLTTSRSADFAEEQEMLQYVGAYTWSIALIAVIIGGVGVMNTMLMSVVERTREIGVMRATGWRSVRVMRMILAESLVVSVLGGGTGVALGYGLLIAVKNVPTVGAFISGELSPELVLQASTLAIGLGLFGGGVPAWRASKLAPADAMRDQSKTSNGARHIRSSALRNVMRQPVRTLLTIIGIGVAMFSMVLLGGLTAGIKDTMAGMTGGGGAHLVGMEAEGNIDMSKIKQDDIRRIAALPGVKHAEGFLTGYTSTGDLPFFIVFGYQPRGLSIQSFPVIEGEPLTTNRQMILGRVAARNLDKQVGQSLEIFGQRYKIVGIFESGVPFEDGGAVVTLRDAQKLFGQTGMVSFAGIWLDDTTQSESMIELIESGFPEVDLSIASEFVENANDMQMMDSMTWGIAMVALVVGGLGMTNTMIMSVFERTREIGVMRALGWSRRRILSMIIRESVILSLLGGAAGTAVGLVLGYLLNYVPVLEGFVQLRYEPVLFLQAIGTAIILGIVGGFYPAWRATRLAPVEALRYE